MPSVVNPAHRVLSPTVNHLHKVLREKDGESFSLLRENQKSLICFIAFPISSCQNRVYFSIAFRIWKPYLFLKNTQTKLFLIRKNCFKSLEGALHLGFMEMAGCNGGG